jgi:hypothetical protein
LKFIQKIRAKFEFGLATFFLFWSLVPENKFQMICLRGTSVIEQKAEISIIDKSRDITPQRKKNQYPTQLASYDSWIYI